MPAQVGSSSCTEGDLKRKTTSECRRNGVRMGGNEKPAGEANGEEREEWRDG